MKTITFDCENADKALAVMDILVSIGAQHSGSGVPWFELPSRARRGGWQYMDLYMRGGRLVYHIHGARCYHMRSLQDLMDMVFPNAG